MKFRGNESFLFRDNWAYKIIHNNRAFNQKTELDRAVSLGVGTNMVKAMKYYGLNCGLIDHTNNLTHFGALIKQKDPYCEDTGTLILCHYFLTQKDNIYNYFFNTFDIDYNFSANDFKEKLNNHLAQKNEKIPSDKLINDDFHSIINSYSIDFNNNNDPEDNKFSCFSEFNLIEKIGKLYNKVSFDSTLIPTIIGTIILLLPPPPPDSLSKDERSLTEVSNDFKFLNLNPTGIIELLRRIEKLGFIKLITTAGLDIVKLNLPKQNELLANYYTNLKKSR